MDDNDSYLNQEAEEDHLVTNDCNDFYVVVTEPGTVLDYHRQVIDRWYTLQLFIDRLPTPSCFVDSDWTSSLTDLRYFLYVYSNLKNDF